jgi:hypothetical protein
MNRIKTRMKKIAKLDKMKKFAFGESVSEVYEEIKDDIEHANRNRDVERIYFDTDNGDGEWFYIVEGDTDKFTVIVAQNDEDGYTSTNKFELSQEEFLDMSKDDFEREINEAIYYAE